MAPTDRGRRLRRPFRLGRGLLALLGSVVLVVAGISPAAGASTTAPHVVREIPFYWAWPIATNVVTHTTYVADIRHDRMMVLDDRSGGFTIKALHGCPCTGEQVSDDHAGNLFLAPGGETPGLFVLNERTLQQRRISLEGMWSLAVDQTTDTVYAGDAFNRVIHIIDGKTGAFRGVIHSGFAAQLTVDPIRGLLYALNQNIGDAPVRGGSASALDLAVIDLRTHQVVGHLPQAAGGIGTIDLRRNLIYAPMAGGIAVLAGRSGTTVTRIRLPQGLNAGAMQLNPDNRRLYVTASSGCFACPVYVVVIDAGRGMVMGTLPVGTFATGLSIDPSLNRVYVPTEFHVTVLAG